MCPKPSGWCMQIPFLWVVLKVSITEFGHFNTSHNNTCLWMNFPSLILSGVHTRSEKNLMKTLLGEHYDREISFLYQSAATSNAHADNTSLISRPQFKHLNKWNIYVTNMITIISWSRVLSSKIIAQCLEDEQKQ
jgi:hypothetical protein